MSSEILNEQEEAYLRSLKESHVWLSILEKLSTFQAPPLYTPANRDPKDQYDRWVYESGALRGVKGMISILNGSETPIILKPEDKQ